MLNHNVDDDFWTGELKKCQLLKVKESQFVENTVKMDHQQTVNAEMWLVTIALNINNKK